MEINYSGLISLVVFLVVLVVFLRYEALHEDEEVIEEETITNQATVHSPLDINDEDATIACLIASIELREQTHKNVQVISVREVK